MVNEKYLMWFSNAVFLLAILALIFIGFTVGKGHPAILAGFITWPLALVVGILWFFANKYRTLRLLLLGVLIFAFWIFLLDKWLNIL